jgi:ectoine hydroxylase-related dioxygenase (phytanoyl-CoA dioxygenase family)
VHASTFLSDYTERGFAVLPGFYGPAELAELSHAFDRLEARAHGLRERTKVGDSLFVVETRGAAVKIDRIVWCGGAEPVLGALGRTPALLAAAASLLGSRDMDQLINQAHIKNPGDGVRFDFHQDSAHRRYGTDLFHDVNGRGSFVQTLTALDPMDADNGGLFVLPESHRRGHVAPVDGKLPDGVFELARAIPLVLSPGDTLFMSPFTVHGSGPNRGSTRRRLFINGFATPGANRREYPGAGRGFRVTAPLDPGIEPPRAA